MSGPDFMTREWRDENPQMQADELPMRASEMKRPQPADDEVEPAVLILLIQVPDQPQ